MQLIKLTLIGNGQLPLTVFFNKTLAGFIVPTDVYDQSLISVYFSMEHSILGLSDINSWRISCNNALSHDVYFIMGEGVIFCVWGYV